MFDHLGRLTDKEKVTLHRAGKTCSPRTGLLGVGLALGIAAGGVAACGGNTETDEGVTDDSGPDSSTGSGTTSPEGDGDDATSGGDSDGDDPDLLEGCLDEELEFDRDQPLNTIDDAERDVMCAWYQRVWECVIDEAAMCRGEGLRAGSLAVSESNDGVATCRDAERACLNTEPQVLESLRSCLEIDALRRCEGNFDDYLLCLRANFQPALEIPSEQYSCEDLPAYIERVDEGWTAPPECEAFTDTCTF